MPAVSTIAPDLRSRFINGDSAGPHDAVMIVGVVLHLPFLMIGLTAVIAANDDITDAKWFWLQADAVLINVRSTATRPLSGRSSL